MKHNLSNSPCSHCNGEMTKTEAREYDVCAACLLLEYEAETKKTIAYWRNQPKAPVYP